MVFPTTTLTLLACISLPFQGPGLLAGGNGYRYKTTLWTTAHGLPQHTVTSIEQTADGYLWVGTFGGLARFDGVDFQVFDIANTAALASDRILDLQECSAAKLWIATTEGISTHVRGVFQCIEVPEDPRRPIWALTEDHDRRIWAVQSHRLLRYDAERFVEIPVGVDVDSQAIFCDSRNRIWFGTSAGVGVLDAGVAREHEGPRGVLSISERADGSILIGTSTQTHVLTDAEPELFASPITACRSILARDDGTLWLAGQEGLAVVDEAQDLHTLEGPWGRMRCVYGDREGNTWIGTDIHGLVRLRESPALEKHLPSDSTGALSVCLDTDGSVLATFPSAGVYRYAGGEFELLAEMREARAILRSSTGELWIGSLGQIRHTREDETVEHPIGSDRSQVIFEDSTGGIWAGAGTALLRYDEDEQAFRTVCRPAHLTGEIHTISQVSDGAIWFGGAGGAGRVAGADISAFTIADGLPRGPVRVIHPMPNGDVWFGTYGGGLALLRDGAFTRITKEQGLFDNSISCIYEREGWFWINSNRGLFRVHAGALTACALDKSATVACSPIATPEANGGAEPSYCVDDGGTLWLPTVRGLVAVHTGGVPPPLAAPRTRVTTVLVNDEERSVMQEPISVEGGGADLEIRYSGVSLVNPEDVRFRYFLEGFDDDWHDVGGRRTAIFTNVPPGRYVFHVASASPHSAWSENPTSVTFEVIARFFETLGFRISVAGGLLLAAVLAIRLRSHRQHDRVEALVREVSERTASEQRVQRMMDELDHRVKNNLGVVLSLLEMTRRSAPESVEVFCALVAARVRALALAHRSLAAAHWTSLTMDELARPILAPYLARGTHEIVLQHSPLPIPARMCTALALCLHELAANALAHGALATPGGSVTIRTESERAGHMAITWHEDRDGPAPDPGPLEEGVGLRLIRGCVEHELGGELHFESHERGIVCRMEFDRLPWNATAAALPDPQAYRRQNPGTKSATNA
ncbi:MAG: hypothetical protein GY711_17105 [bacterium]|nr:hypothetical protein [bacterium]